MDLQLTGSLGAQRGKGQRPRRCIASDLEIISKDFMEYVSMQQWMPPVACLFRTTSRGRGNLSLRGNYIFRGNDAFGCDTTFGTANTANAARAITGFSGCLDIGQLKFKGARSGVDKRVVFQKGGFDGCSPRMKRGYIRMFPRNENQNEGTFAKTTLLQNRPFVSQ